MAQYQYPYQKIVDLKKSEKTQAEWELSAALSKLQTEAHDLEQLEKERASWQRKLHAASADIIPLSELQTVQTYLDYLDDCITKKNQAIRAARSDVELNQSRLSVKVKDEKVWLKAKEQAFHRFMHTMQRKEQNELDEIATVRYMIPAH
ncbi:flagellar export protein FliJ [Paenibacillus tarimensis]